MSIRRPQVEPEVWEKALEEASQTLLEKIEKHGAGACVSLHEIAGLVDEEVREYHGAVHANDVKEARSELYDIIVAALWGIVSIDSDTTSEEWDG